MLDDLPYKRLQQLKGMTMPEGRAVGAHSKTVSTIAPGQGKSRRTRRMAVHLTVAEIRLVTNCLAIVERLELAPIQLPAGDERLDPRKVAMLHEVLGKLTPRRKDIDLDKSRSTGESSEESRSG